MEGRVLLSTDSAFFSFRTSYLTRTIWFTELSCAQLISCGIILFCYQLSSFNIKHLVTWWVICFFFSLFPSIDYLIPNSVLVSVAWFHQRYRSIFIVRNIPFSAFVFFDKLASFVSIFLRLTYDVICLFSLVFDRFYSSIPITLSLT